MTNQIERADFLHQLRRVNAERYESWSAAPIMLCAHCGRAITDAASAGSTHCNAPFDYREHEFTKPHPYLTSRNDAGIMFDALELGGEVGELLNVVKKLEREERGWRGSRATKEDFADECADVLICLDKLARRHGVDLAEATIAKFNATSDKVGLPHKLATLTNEAAPAGEVDRLSHVIDRDRYVAAACLGTIDKVLKSRSHLAEPGRGSYEWDDERYQQEFGLALDEIREALQPLRRLARDKTDCTTDPEKVKAARIAGAERFATLAPQTTIPAGMKPWHGGDSAPEDWDGGPVFRRALGIVELDPAIVTDPSFEWMHHDHGRLHDLDIIAYTPKAPAEPTGEVVSAREMLALEYDRMELPSEAKRLRVNLGCELTAEKAALAVIGRLAYLEAFAAEAGLPPKAALAPPPTQERTPAWKEYEADFNAMSDEEIEDETRSCRDQVDEAESWLEAVASWEAAGKPRRAALNPVTNEGESHVQ